MAGTPRNPLDNIIDQNLLTIKEYEKLMQQDGLDDESKQIYQDVIDEINNSIDELERLKTLTQGSEKITLGCPEIYWKSLNDLNTQSSLRNLDIPMLIQQGQKDVQIYANKDFVQWKNLLSDRSNCHFRLYENLNHCFIKSKGCNILNATDDYWIQDNVDENVINDIAEFVNNYSK